MTKEQAIKDIQNMEVALEEDEFDPYMSGIMSEDVINSISSVLSSGGFQDTDLVRRFQRDEISRDDFSSLLLDDLNKQFEDNDIHTYRETRSHLIIENQAEFIATQAALTNNNVFDFYVDGSEEQIQLVPIPQQPIEPLEQSTEPQLEFEQPLEQSTEPQPEFEQPPIEQPIEPQPEFESQSLEQPIEPQPLDQPQLEFEQPIEQQPQLEFEQPIEQQPQLEFEQPIEQQPQLEFEQPIEQQPQLEFEQQPQLEFEQPIEQQPQLEFENIEEFNTEDTQGGPNTMELEFEDIQQTNPNVFYEEEYQVSEMKNQEPIEIEEDYSVYVGDMNPQQTNPMPIQPQPQQVQPQQMSDMDIGLLEGVQDNISSNDFEIDNEVDSDIYDLGELKLNRIDTTHI